MRLSAEATLVKDVANPRLVVAKAEQGQGGMPRAADQMMIYYGERRDDGVVFLPHNHIMIVIGIGVLFKLGTPSVYYGNSINTNAFVLIISQK